MKLTGTISSEPRKATAWHFDGTQQSAGEIADGMGAGVWLELSGEAEFTGKMMLVLPNGGYIIMLAGQYVIRDDDNYVTRCDSDDFGGFFQESSAHDG